MKPKSIHYVSEYRWHVGLMAAPNESCLFAVLEELFASYIKKGKPFIDFFLLDYFIALLYDELPQIKSCIDKLPYSNPGFYTL